MLKTMLTGRSQLWTLAVVFFVTYMPMKIIYTVLPLYVKQIGGTHNDVGLAMGLGVLGYFIGYPLWGWISDRSGKRIIYVILGPFGYLCMAGALAVSTMPSHIIIFHFAGAFIASAAQPALKAYVGDVTTQEDRGRWMGTMVGAATLGMSVGALLAGATMSGGFEKSLGLTGYIALAAMGLAGIAIWKDKQGCRRAPEKRISSQVLRTLLTGRSLLWILAAVFFLTFMPRMMMATMLPLYVKHMGGSNNDVGLVMGLGYLGYFFGCPFWGWISDRSRKRIVYVILGPFGYMCMAGALAVAGTPFHVIISYFAAAFIASAAMPALGAYVGDVTTPEVRARWMGVMSGSSTLGMSVGGVVSGVAMSKGFEECLGLTGCIGLLAMGLAVIAIWKDFQINRRGREVVDNPVIVLPNDIRGKQYEKEN